jgi:hypothetical protein
LTFSHCDIPSMERMVDLYLIDCRWPREFMAVAGVQHKRTVTGMDCGGRKRVCLG